MCFGACAQRGGGRGCGASCPSCQRRSCPSPDTLPPWPPGTPCTPSVAGSVPSPTCAPRPGLRPRSRLRPRPCLRPYHRRRSPPLPSLGSQPGDNSRPLCIQFQCLFQRLTRTFFGERSSCVWSSRCEQQGEWQDTIALPACCRCGRPTESVEAGAKRQCTGEGRHRVYPRTDPVVRLLPST